MNIYDLTEEEFDTINEALLAYKYDMLNKSIYSKDNNELFKKEYEFTKELIYKLEEID